MTDRTMSMGRALTNMRMAAGDTSSLIDIALRDGIAALERSADEITALRERNRALEEGLRLSKKIVDTYLYRQTEKVGDVSLIAGRLLGDGQ